MKKILVMVAVILLAVAGQAQALEVLEGPDHAESSLVYRKFFTAFWMGMGILQGKLGNLPDDYSILIEETVTETRNEEGALLRLGIVITSRFLGSEFLKVTFFGLGGGGKEENEKILNAAGAVCLKVYFEIRKKIGSAPPI